MQEHGFLYRMTLRPCSLYRMTHRKGSKNESSSANGSSSALGPPAQLAALPMQRLIESPSRLPFPQRHAVHQEEVAGARVPAAPVHAADQTDLVGFDIELVHVHQVVADMDMDHPAHLQHRIAAERQAGDAFARETDRRLGYARRLYPGRRCGGQLRGIELADLVREVDRADVHALRKGLIDQVD